MDKNLIEKRFIATLVAIFCVTGMLYAGRIGATNYEQIIIWCLGLFVGGDALAEFSRYYSVASVANAKQGPVAASRPKE